MEEKCSKLYKAIRNAYEDMTIRQDNDLSKILLSASNEVIRSGDAGLSALHLDRQLNLYSTRHDFSLPKGAKSLKQLTQEFAGDDRKSKEVSQWIKPLLGE